MLSINFARVDLDGYNTTLQNGFIRAAKVEEFHTNNKKVILKLITKDLKPINDLQNSISAVINRRSEYVRELKMFFFNRNRFIKTMHKIREQL